jgi:hypothetical protein
MYQSCTGCWFGPKLKSPRVEAKSALRSASRKASMSSTPPVALSAEAIRSAVS